VGDDHSGPDVTERRQAEEALREREATLRGILNATSESIWLFSVDGVALAANQTALARWGRPEETVIGKSASEFLPEELARSRLARFREVAQTGLPVEFEDCRDGIRFEHTFYPVLDADGHVDRIAIFSRDVTERSRVEDSLRRYELLASHSRDIVLFMRREDGRILEANAAAQGAYGYGREELLALSIRDLRAPATRPLAAEQMALADAHGLLFETVHQRRDGSTFPVEVSSRGATMAGTHTLISVVRDITERRQAEETLRAAHLRTTAILERIADAFFSLDDQWRFVMVNPAAARAPFGRPASELLGTVIWDVFPAIVGTRIHRHYLDAVAQRSREHYEAPSPLNGRWYEVFMFPRPGGLDVYLRDIDERKRLERLYWVLSQVNEAIVRTRDVSALYEEVCRIVAHEGQFPLVWIGLLQGTAVVPAARCGAAADYLEEIRVEVAGELGAGPTGTCVREDRAVLNDDFDRNAATAPWREAARKRGFRSSAALPIHRGGRPVGALTLYASTPGAFDPAQVQLLTALCADLSYAMAASEQERRRSEAERALLEREQSLREADRRKDEFLAVLSHELRNPLAPIRNSVFLLQHAPPDGEQAARARDIIDRQSAHLARLVDDLLDLNRISRGKIELQRQRVDLAELVRRTAEDHRANFMERGIGLHVQAVHAPVWLNADPTRIAQVVGNLLGNACKFTPQSGSVRVTVAVEESRAVLRVRDTGTGIAAELLDRIFDPFIQAEQNLARSQGGLGLGLSLVRGFVELHGGTVTVASDGPERGAEFVVRLPLLERVVFDQPPGAVAAAPRTLRVLVIEDNRDAAESLRDVIEFLGHTVQVAFDGGSGGAAARTMRPDLVLCDIGLPDTDGYAVARELKAEPRLAGCMLVALTGYTQPADLRQATEAGFDRHLAKPPSLDELRQLLAAAAAKGGRDT
jgi:PAS domain S-box-containing protein